LFDTLADFYFARSTLPAQAIQLILHFHRFEDNQHLSFFQSADPPDGIATTNPGMGAFK